MADEGALAGGGKSETASLRRRGEGVISYEHGALGRLIEAVKHASAAQSSV